ncbi:hypothetical protein [Mesorhizobium sp. IMUNJ 23232]|uniref:hypothetical protein n=1 Tax=Mesorhizobium sp. IMUNJ 23232 TaxID=3376064 RepID=UPI003792D32E
MIRRFRRTCTEDGTWIVVDPATGLSTSARHLLDAIADLRRHALARGAQHARAREAHPINVSMPTTFAGWKHL